MRIGLVGYGHGGRYFHGPLLASLAGATFVGVVSRDAGRRRQLAADHPGLPAFDSLAQLVEAGVDIAVICTPLAGRRELILEAIARGIGVVSDKPFAVDAREAEELIRAARDKGVLLSVYQNRRWDSDFLTVRKLIAANALGRISRFESRMERYAPATVGDPGGGGSFEISAVTWWTRRCNCSARWRGSTPKWIFSRPTQDSTMIFSFR
ncbi:hypothetical protein PHLH7_32250 [Pseudomonas sp. Ost2]|nr:hypothetical protein PHLH7_32250 [Pseudomonas sp. Ost2]